MKDIADGADYSVRPVRRHQYYQSLKNFVRYVENRSQMRNGATGIVMVTVQMSTTVAVRLKDVKMSEQREDYVTNNRLLDQGLEDDFDEEHRHAWDYYPSVVFDFIFRCPCGDELTPSQVRQILNQHIQPRDPLVMDLDGYPLTLSAAEMAERYPEFA